MKPKRFERSADVGLLVAHFAKRAADKDSNRLVSYDEIKEQIGRDVRLKRSIIQSVKRILLNEENIVIACETNQGYRILDNEETLGNVSSDVSRVHRVASVGRKKLSTVNVEGLPHAQRRSLYTHVALLGVLHNATGASRIKKLETALTNGEAKQIPLANVLEQLKSL